MADSIQKRITDALMARLVGDADNSPPAGIAASTVDKDRRIPMGMTDLPRYSVYFVTQDPPIDMSGNPRRPTLVKRVMTVETRVIVAGTSDELDPHVQWVTKQMASADRLITDDCPHGLTMSVSEGAQQADVLEGSDNKVTELKMHWAVEYTTDPVDITRTGREAA